MGLRVLSAGAVKGGVAELARRYAREREVAVDVEFATAPEVKRRLLAGEHADFVVAPPTVLDELARAGRVAAESRAFIGRSRMGVVVHAGSGVQAVPDVAQLKEILANASAVVRNRASSGAYAEQLLQALGIAAALGNRAVVVDTGSAVMQYVADHPTRAVGLAQISEIRVMLAKGLPIRFAGPLPDAVQNVTRYEAAAVAGADEEAHGRALAQYMATPEAKKVFAETGID